jgi:hypothetical protein
MRAIAPGVLQSYSASVTAPHLTPEQGVGSANYVYAGPSFRGGYAWAKETINAPNPGDAVTDEITGVMQFGSSGRIRKNYFNWLGSDIEASSIYGGLDQTWQADEINQSLPKSNKVSLLAPNDIFTKNTEAEVTISRAVTVSGKLSFQAEAIKPKVRVLKMPQAQGGSVKDTKYWA